MSDKLQKLVESLDQLTLIEAAELSKMLQEKWGVSAAAPVAMAGMPVAAAGPAEHGDDVAAQPPGDGREVFAGRKTGLRTIWWWLG